MIVEAKERPPLKVLDLFSGAGGFSLGFHAVGCQTIAAMDRDVFASNTFRRNFGPDVQVFGGPDEGDAENLTPERLESLLEQRPDIIIGGPPCQGFSRIGRAKQASLLELDERTRQGGVTDPARNLLYRYFLEVVERLKPRAFVMENVPGMRQLHGVDVARRAAREAAHLGYNVRYFLLNAAHFGVPQVRWRLFFVGYRADLGPYAIPRPPVRTHAWESEPGDGMPYSDDERFLMGESIPRAPVHHPAVTVIDALGDLPRLRGHLDTLADGEVTDRPLPLAKRCSAFAEQMRAWPGFEGNGTVTGNWYRFTTRDFETFARMAPGDRYPQALRSAWQRFQEALRERAALGQELVPGSSAYDALKDRLIPPYRNDAFDEKWRKLLPDQPSWTVTAHLSQDTYSHIHYDSRQARAITIREAARLQSFPDGFLFSGNHGEQFRQIGNAVPPLLAKAIAGEVVGGLGDGEVPRLTDRSRMWRGIVSDA